VWRRCVVAPCVSGVRRARTSCATGQVHGCGGQAHPRRASAARRRVRDPSAGAPRPAARDGAPVGRRGRRAHARARPVISVEVSSQSRSTTPFCSTGWRTRWSESARSTGGSRTWSSPWSAISRTRRPTPSSGRACFARSARSADAGGLESRPSVSSAGRRLMAPAPSSWCVAEEPVQRRLRRSRVPSTHDRRSSGRSSTSTARASRRRLRGRDYGWLNEPRAGSHRHRIFRAALRR